MIAKQKLFIIASVLLGIILPGAVIADVSPLFNPSVLIEDKVFSDTQTFGGSAGIQKFLESKQSVLANTATDFLVKLKEPPFKDLKTKLEDPGMDVGRLRTAAELIWDASRQSGLNPQVILVTLQKEQGLITNHQNDRPEVLQKALDRAMGFDCPDSTGCGNLFPGFYFQLFGNVDLEGNRYLGASKSLMKSFSTPGGRGPVVDGRTTKVGEIVNITNTTGGPNNAPPSQSVQLSNNATAALYRFTPHVFNGNYNFWKYFNDWFKYPNGTLIHLATDAGATYIIQNGSRLLLPNFVAQARGLDLLKTITVSPNELDNYPQGGTYGPADNTIVKVEGETQKYVFIANVKHPTSDFVIEQRKLNPTNALTVTSAELSSFGHGDILTPTDGTVLRGQTLPAVYLVEGGQLKLFSVFTFNQRKVAKQVQIIPDAEMNSYPKKGFVAPVDGTLIKSSSSSAVYIIGQGTKHPVSGAVFKNRGLSFKNVVTLANDEAQSLGLDGFAEPKDRSFFKTSDNVLYIYKEGAKHSISGFVAKQRGISADFTVSLDEANSWVSGIAIPPKDGTVVKGDKDGTVYIVAKGQLQPMTATAFANRKIKAKSVVVLPQAEVESYAKGEVLSK